MIAKLGDALPKGLYQDLKQQCRVSEAKKAPAVKAVKDYHTTIARALDQVAAARIALGADANKVRSLKQVERHLKAASAASVNEVFPELDKLNLPGWK